MILLLTAFVAGFAWIMTMPERKTPIFHPLMGWNPLRLALYQGPQGKVLLVWFGWNDKSVRLFPL